MKTLIPALVLVAAGGLAGGCATVSQSDFEAVKAMAEQAQLEAAEAKRMAADAAATADAAADEAASAQRAATAADQRAQDTEAKIDRMFKKAMYK